MLNGKELGIASKSEALPEVTNLNPESIQEITVLKREEAVKIYGEKAAGGAIVITTKE
ncbi:hypothetical protein GCM10028895_34810 [Pontibacter rugosus]